MADYFRNAALDQLKRQQMSRNPPFLSPTIPGIPPQFERGMPQGAPNPMVQALEQRLAGVAPGANGPTAPIVGHDTQLPPEMLTAPSMQGSRLVGMPPTTEQLDEGMTPPRGFERRNPDQELLDKYPKQNISDEQVLDHVQKNMGNAEPYDKDALAPFTGDIKKDQDILSSDPSEENMKAFVELHGEENLPDDREVNMNDEAD